jgi:hypothetical protein
MTAPKEPVELTAPFVGAALLLLLLTLRATQHPVGREDRVMSLSLRRALLARLAVPLLLIAPWWVNRRRRRSTITAGIALIRAALPGRTSWRRRIPVFQFLTGPLALWRARWPGRGRPAPYRPTTPPSCWQLTSRPRCAAATSPRS